MREACARCFRSYARLADARSLTGRHIACNASCTTNPSGAGSSVAAAGSATGVADAHAIGHAIVISTARRRARAIVPAVGRSIFTATGAASGVAIAEGFYLPLPEGVPARVFVGGQWRLATPKVLIGGEWTPATIHMPH